jgi:hypothetical protein
MGMYCCCGVKKRDGWVCECDWNGWNLCFEFNSSPKNVHIKSHPDIDGVYEVRTFGDGGDYHEEESEFSIEEKNWGQPTNQAISRWKIEYDDHYMGLTVVYAWKEKSMV